jgi:hypothetical protein
MMKIKQNPLGVLSGDIFPDEERKKDLKDYTSPNLLVEQLSERVKELGSEIITHEDLELRLVEDKHKNWLKWKQTEQERERLSKLLIEARIKIVESKSNYQRIIKEVLECDPIPASKRLDDKLEPPWEVVKRIRTRIKELEGGINLLIGYIPNGWEMPLGWTYLVNQVKKLLEDK